MFDFLLENPVVIGLAGLLLAIAAGVVWIQTGSRAAAVVAAATALVTVVLVYVSLRTETDREQIQRTIDEVAEALADNDFPRVYSYIHSGAVPAVQRARTELPNYQFLDARLTRLRSIVVDRRSNPPTAIAEFNVALELAAQGQKIPIRRLVKVYFGLENERWLVRDYEHFEPLAGISQVAQE
jgi:hypothetical protein